MSATADTPCNECGEPIGEDGEVIVTTVTEPGVVKVVGLGLCGEHKGDKLARDKIVWAIERATGK